MSKNNTHKNTYRLCILLLSTLIFTTIAGIASIHIATKYYALYPFHFDSASYLYTALKIYHLFKIESFPKVLYESFFLKDGLDVILRLLFFPGALDKLFGHMYILLPFMGSFIFLLMHYVYQRTSNVLLAILAAVFLFAFPLMYSPYFGIADYWKGNLAIWLLGDALICALLSDFFTKWKWNVLTSIFLGLLVMQRSALAIYVAIFLAPYVIFCIYYQLKSSFRSSLIINMLALVIPSILTTALLIMVQGKLLYNYYVVSGYNYGTYGEAFHSIFWLINIYIHKPFLIINIIAVVNFLLFFNQKNKDFYCALWFIIGFSCSIVAVKGIYEEAANVFWVLSVIFATTSLTYLGKSASSNLKYAFTIILFLLSISYSISLYVVFNKNPNHYPIELSEWKAIYAKIDDIIVQHGSHAYANLYDESTVLLLEQLKFENGIDIFSSQGIVPVGFFAQHDTYYYGKYGTKKININQIANENIQAVEKAKNVIAVTYCTAADATKSSAFQIDGQKVAMPYARESLKIIQSNPKWRLLQKLNTQFGCLSIYWYNSAD